MIAVWPSLEIERPRVGGRIEATRGSERRIAVDFATAPANAGLADGLGGRVEHDHQGVARLAAEVRLDQVACLDGLRAGGLPAGAGEGLLDPRREGAERDDDDEPGDRDGAAMRRHEAAEPAERADVRGGVHDLGRRRDSRGGDGGHRPAPERICWSSSSWRWTLPQTSSQIASTLSSPIR